MSGTDIIGQLLRSAPSVVAIVPEDSMKAGALPEKVTLPALLLRTVSGVDRPTLKRGATRRTTERVSVMVRAASYREQKAIIRLVRSTCADRTGTIAGFANVSVLTAGKGPDLAGPAASFEQTQDFRVSFDEPA